MYQSKHEAGASHRNDLITFTRSFSEHLSPFLRHSFEAASELGALCWLTTLPIAEHRFAMPKGEFRNALRMFEIWVAACSSSTILCVWLSVVLVAALQQFVIIKYVTLLLISLVRFVQMLVMSLLFNLLIVNLCSMLQLIGKMVLSLM